MNALLRPALLVSLSMLVPGCSLPEVETSLEGPAFVLTAEEPVAAFEVSLCLEGAVPKELYVDGSLTAEARTTSGEATLRLESLADRADDAHTDSTVVGAEGTGFLFWLAAEGSWKDSGRRCSTPEVIEFSVEGLAQGQSMEVDAWAVRMLVEFQPHAFGGDGPEEGDLSVQIERL